MQFLKQSTAYTFRAGPFLDSTDGVTAETGLTISQADVRLSKAGGAFAQKNSATAATHDENGWYSIVLNTTDTNTLGTLDIAINESGALPVWRHFMVIPANIYDSFIAGSDYLQVDAVQVEGSDATDQINAACDTAVADYDGPTKAELDSGLAGLNDLSAAQVNAEVDTALSDYDPPTKAELDSGLAGLNDLSAAQVNAEVDTALSDYDPPTKAELDTAVSPLATSAEITALNDPTAATIADAVWDEAISGHLTAGTTGEALNDAGAAGSPPTVTEIRQEIDTNSTQLAAIIADTNELQTDDVPGLIAALNDPTVSAIADAVWDEAKSGHVTAGSFGEEVQAHALSTEISALNNLSAAQVNAEVDTALSDYDPPTKAELDSGLAGLNDLSAAQVNAEVDTALADYDGPTKAELDAGLAALNDLSAAQVNAEVLDVLNADTFSELTAVPTATPTITQMLRWLFLLSRNQIEQNATTQTIRADDAATAVASATVSDNGTTATRGEFS